MTMDVMRQIRDDDRTDVFPLTSVVYIGNSMHVVEPVNNDTDQLTDETGKSSVKNGLRRRSELALMYGFAMDRKLKLFAHTCRREIQDYHCL